MNAFDRLKHLSSNMDLEPSEDAGCPIPHPRQEDIYLSRAVLPNGKRITLLKTLLTSACERNCYYCPFRAGRDFRRVTFKPLELAKTFMALHAAGIAEGLFLSSGIAGGGVRTQDLLIDTADILRLKLGYRGYLHLKIMPGADKAQVARSMQLCDRISVNLEAPNTKRLQMLAPHKQFIDELIQPLRWIEEIRSTQPAHLGWDGQWPSSVTQFVVGGVGESDLELLSTTEHLYNRLRLKRTYFSAFKPFPDTPMDHITGATLQREHRLYQASFLLRDYGFDLEELPLNPSGNLPLNTDPKLAWAQSYLINHPIEINRAGHQELLRIPGIGPKSAHAILSFRRQNLLKNLSELGRIGINTKRIAPFILLNGRRTDQQISFW